NVKSLQRQIDNLIVICPRQFERDLEASESREEGKTLMRPGCNFKGSIKEVNDHLNNSCPLKPLACWFQSFGCDHSCLKGELEEHLVLQKKHHFDLVVKHVESLQQKIQHSQEESTKLQVENQILKSEIETSNKEIHSKNDAIQKLKDNINIQEGQLLKKNYEINTIQDQLGQEKIQYENALESLKIDFELTKLLKENDKQIDEFKEQSIKIIATSI
ncbi:hypothetical protein RFI_37774, partial [Reticulomyxa filosa]